MGDCWNQRVGPLSGLEDKNKFAFLEKRFRHVASFREKRAAWMLASDAAVLETASGCLV